MNTPDIGSRIRTLRRRMGWTLQDVADRCDFTRSLLSKIETGKTIPPVATLTRIAQTLGVSVSSLLDDGEDHGTIVQSADAHHVDAMTPTDKGYKFFAFAANRSQKLMQPLLFEARKDSIKPQAMTHGGEEFVYVLSGKMRYRVGSTVHLLKPGDSVYFDSDQEHELEPVSEVVRFLAVFAEAPKPAKKQSRKGRK
ncbi:MAG TPA: XRE family transcriptional regulator [Phycisphaerales bacterium]|nr:XRE family transcriptional regulator [Phycisphaerales bacterium]HCD35395.1 XRE family transcriptional regulator [Phycisphaerales bacterium]|tara:strand:- start:2368 stop:2955 length:588 start_codon:yes stop_codon:yes gene_type:complete